MNKKESSTTTKMQNVSMYSNYVNNFESFQKKRQLSSGNQTITQVSSPGASLRHASVQEKLIELPRKNHDASSETSSVSTEDFSAYSSPVQQQQLFSSLQNYTTPLNQTRSFQPVSSLNSASSLLTQTTSALTPIISSDTLVQPSSASSALSWRERLEKFEEASAQKQQESLVNIEKLLNSSVLPLSSKKLNLFSTSETPAKISPDISSNNRQSVNALSSYFSTPSKPLQQEITPPKPSNQQQVINNKETTSSVTTPKNFSPALYRDKNPEEVVLLLRTELNKKGIEIIEVQNEKLKLSSQFQQEKDKWEQLRRSKDSVIRQKQDEIFAKEMHMKELKDEISNMKIRTENAVNDQQIYQEKCVELQDMVELFVVQI